MNQGSSRRRHTPTDPEAEARVRLRDAQRGIDQLLSGQSVSPLLDVARVCHLVDQARSLLWAASWNKEAV